MFVPLEIAFRLGQANFVVVVTANYARSPVIVELTKFGIEVNYVGTICVGHQ